jgi:hypothetical protein
MSNIRTSTFKNIMFYYTNKTSIQCKKDDQEYVKPLYYTLSQAKEHDITIRRSYLAQNGREYNQYGNLTFEQLNEIWTQNNGFFEILKEERKPYFDVEFPNNEKYNNRYIYKIIIKVIKKVFEQLNIPIGGYENIHSCYVKGKYSNGPYEGLDKHSYHIIIDNNYKFQSLQDIIIFKTYLSNYCNDLYVKKGYDMLFKSDDGCVIDFNVYGKNQCFKLPYQSKSSNNYFQVPELNDSKLNNFLISYGIENYDIINVEYLNIKNNDKILKIKNDNHFYHIPKSAQNIVMIYNNCLQKIDKSLYKSNDTIYDVNPETLIKYIYNGDTIDYNVFMAVGSALKRLYNENPKNKGFELFDEWSKKSNKYNYEYTKQQYEGYSSKSCGYKTLFYLASLCNENIIKFNEDPINYIMNDDIYKNYMKKEILNVRYLPPINDYLNKYDNLFIKSPMGTGKSYGLHNIFNEKDKNGQIKYKRIVYLSSRQAFACAMASDFEQDGFINYLNKSEFNGKNERVIISLESLNRIHYDECDILVIDESESIFNIISSETLIKNKLEENLIKLYSLISLSKKVLIMDAFLTNRSIKVLTDIKDININNSYYIENEYKYDERYFKICEDKKMMINMIINLLQENKRVVLCTGSKGVGDMLVHNIKKYIPEMIENIDYKFYNRLNQLPNNTNVNEEWKNIKLLIYSPTITCGISYDNKQFKFDNLFIYCVNRGSSHFRDMIQAHKRVREFTDKTINICINDNYKGFNPEQYPINYDIMKEYLTTHKKELIFDDRIKNNMTDLHSDDLFKNWVFDIHIYNKIEMNINMMYLYKVVMKYFEIENIIEDGIASCEKLEINSLTMDDWKYNDIETITKKQYDEIILKFKNNKYDIEDYKKIRKYNFVNKLKSNYDIIFDEWFNKDNRPFINNIINFNKMVSIGFENYEKFSKMSDNIEYYNKNLISFFHIKNILEKLNLIEDNKIVLNKQIQSNDFDDIIDEYKNISSYAINQLFINEYLKTKNKKGDKKKVTTKTIHSILNKLLKDFFNYKIESHPKKKEVIINKKRRKITTYTIKPINTHIDLFANLKQEQQTNIDFIE